jgi:hypothetical protein
MFVVGQTVILPGPESKFSLQKQFIPGNETTFDRSCDRPTDCGFIVMSALIRRVDAAEALL